MRATVGLPELALPSILVQLRFRTVDAFGVRNRVKILDVPSNDKSGWQSQGMSTNGDSCITDGYSTTARGSEEMLITAEL